MGNGMEEFAKMFDMQMKQANEEEKKAANGALFDLYSGLVESGFNEMQALELVKTMLSTMLIKAFS